MKKAIWLVALAYWLFFFLIPPLQTPDENDHYETVYWISRGVYPHQPQHSGPIEPRFTSELFWLFDLRANPPGSEFVKLNQKNILGSSLMGKSGYPPEQSSKFIPITLQSYQTPLFHLVAALVFRLGETLKLNLVALSYFTRLTSAVFYFAFVYLGYLILRRLVSKSMLSPLWIFFALNPYLIKTGVSLNPDIAQATAASLLLYFVLKLPPKLLRLNQVIKLGVLSGITALFKFTGVFTALFAGLFILKKTHTLKQRVIYGVIFGAIFVALLSPWLTVNYLRYGTTSATRGFYIATGHPVTPRPLISSLILGAAEFRHTLMHYSGFLGASNDRYPPKPFFLTYTVVLGLLITLGVWEYFRKMRRDKLVYAYFLSSCGLFLYVLGFYYKKTGMDWDIQGRYALNLWLFAGYFSYLGLKRILSVKEKFIGWGFSGFAVFHYLYILFTLVGSYYY